MIATLLDKIGGLFQKDFLFGSFLPALLFVSILTASITMVLGFDEASSLVQWLTPLQQAALSAIGGIAIVVFAYVLNALRPVFMQLWSGKSQNPIYRLFYALGEWHWRRRFQNLNAKIDAELVWGKLNTERIDRIVAILDDRSNLIAAPPDVVKGLKSKINRLRSDPREKRGRLVVDELVQAYNQYSEASLSPIYKLATDQLKPLCDRESQRRKAAKACRVNEFGPPEAIRATELGNLVEAFHHYAARRYGMEAEIFWPRMQWVINKDYLAIAEDPRIIMEFSVTLATLLLWYVLIVLFAGLWLWFNFWVWGIAGIIAGFGSYFFYRRAVTAARQYAEFNAACFDLFRLDLLDALRAPPPATWSIERENWKTISQLIAYGDTSMPDFKLEPPKPLPKSSGA